MKPVTAIAATMAAGVLAVAGTASAERYEHHEHHDNGHRYGHYKHHKVERRTRVVTRYVQPRRVVVYRSGQYLPRNYYVNRTYYVQPTVYGLRAPPPGYEWVRVGNDVYLTQTRTGLIADVVANLLR